jgi:hypothetical protein
MNVLNLIIFALPARAKFFRAVNEAKEFEARKSRSAGWLERRDMGREGHGDRKK